MKSNKKLKDWIVFLPFCQVGLVAIFVVLFFNYGMVFGGKVPFFRDFYFYNFPNITFHSWAFQKGELPFWNPYLQCGTPFLADATNACFYPFQWIFLFFRFEDAVRFFFLSHFIIAFLNSYFLARSYGVRPPGAYFTAITFTFSGYFVSVINLMKFRAIVWIPLLFGIWKKLELAQGRQRWRWGGGGGIVFGLMVLSGDIFASYFTAIFLFFHLLAYRRKKPKEFFKFYFFIMGLGAAISACQWVPTFFLLQSAQLSQYKASGDFWNLELIRLPLFLIPGLFGLDPHLTHYVEDSNMFSISWTTSVYFGLGAVCLAIWASVRLKGQQRRYLETNFWVILALVSFLISLGSYTPLYGILQEVLPFFKKFRYPEKFLFWLTLSASLLAGKGLDMLFPAREFAKGHLISFLAISILVWWILPLPELAPVYRGKELFVSQKALLRFASLFFLLCVALFWRRSSLALALVLGISLGDLLSLHQRELPLASPRIYNLTISSPLPKPKLYSFRISRFPKDHLMLGNQQPSVPVMLQIGRETMGLNLSAAYGYETADGYSTFAFLRWYKLKETLEAVSFYKMTNTHYLISPYEKKPLFSSIQLNPNFRLYYHSDQKGFAWYKTINPMPRYKFFYKAIFVKNLKEATKVIKRLPYSKMVVIEKQGEGRSWETTVARHQNIRLVNYGYNFLQLELETSQPAWLLILDSYAPGWRAILDGEETEIYPANILFRAITVPSGRHYLRLFYIPPGWVLGKWISLFMLGGIGIWLVWEFFFALRKLNTTAGEVV
ncbi:MAG: hypothetical protein D6805_06240 [Planctomycetota bacterium]|nr:MAG: hypothetical protein D6805_06240 [Planctomycetota bacterium]